MQTEEVPNVECSCFGLCKRRARRDPNKKLQAKAYFSNERTFFQWQSVACTLGMLSLALAQMDLQSVAGGAAAWSLFASVLFLSYAIYLFRRRQRCLNEGLDFQELRMGPTVLVTLLIFSMIGMAMYQKHIKPGAAIGLKHSGKLSP
eukprot:EG_transcript_41313